MTCDHKTTLCTIVHCAVKIGVVCSATGHLRSPGISPFGRSHMTSYSTLIETMHLSCTVFKLYHVICQKSPILTYSTCIWRPCREWLNVNFAKTFGFRKLESLGYVWHCLHDSVFSHFDTILVCETDTWQWLILRKHSVMWLKWAQLLQYCLLCTFLKQLVMDLFWVLNCDNFIF